MSNGRGSTVLWTSPLPRLATFRMPGQHDVTKTAARTWLETILEGTWATCCLNLLRHFVSFFTKFVTIGKVSFAID